MQHDLRPDPDPASLNSPPTETLRAEPDTGAETDLADLAARFSAQTGGGLPLELSTDLALEIVFNEIVEQARLATGATGAAIVLWRDGQMVCRASSGATAPALGSRLDPSSGISGECIRTHRAQRCDDVVANPHADLEASNQLGVRSVMVMPIVEGENLLGVFELLSSRPFAFGDRDERTLEALVSRTRTNLDRAARTLSPAPEVEFPAPASAFLVAETADETTGAGTIGQASSDGTTIDGPTIDHTKIDKAAIEATAVETSPEIAEIAAEAEPIADVLIAQTATKHRSYEWLTLMLGAVVIACAVLLGVLVGRHFGFARVIVRNLPASSRAANQTTPVANMPNTTAADSATAAKPAPVVPPGGLLISQNGKEVFRMPPSRNPGDIAKADQKVGVERAAAIEPDKIMQLEPATAENSLVYRVEPQYPEAARKQKIQGPVVLDVRIAPDGAVEDVRVVSGAPLLTQASSDAVKQWRFKPRLLNGQAVRMETTVTLNFRLPS
jgi:TonB family protein